MGLLSPDAWITHVLLGFALFATSVFLILLILVQRGRGGGLTGALGGMGGQSAFGTKAGDVFTKITVGAAVVWILLCISTILTFRGDVVESASGSADTEQTEADEDVEPGIRGTGGNDASPEQ